MATKPKLTTVEEHLEALDEAKKRNIAQRIAAVMGEVDYIQKEKKQGMNYSIVSHDKVTALVRPALHRHGVICYPRDLKVAQSGNRTEAVFTVRFENIDDRSDYIDVETMGYGVDPQDKGPGKAISYGVKYAYLKCLGLETGDDPDEVQDTRANHEPIAGQVRTVSYAKEDGGNPTGERLPGDMSDSALRGCIKTLVHNLNGVATLQEYEELLELEDAAKTIEQCRRRFPAWWETGAGCPAEFKPLKKILEETRKGLADLETA
jgi:hypothetical protein